MIKVDKEGKEVIEQLCDIALKQGGLSNLNGISNILNSLEKIEPADKEVDAEPAPLKSLKTFPD